jgi:hypothetical protein
MPNVGSSEDTQEQPQNQELFIESSDLESNLQASKNEEKAPVTTTTDPTLEKLSRDSPSLELVHTDEPHSSLQDDFVTSIYPGVQVNLKLKSDEQKLTIEPDTSTGTLSSFKQLDQDFTYGDLDIDDKPEGKETAKPSNETEAISMVSVPIEQDMSAIPTMTIPIPTTTSPRDTTTTATVTTTTHTPTSSSNHESLTSRVERALTTAERAIHDNQDIKTTLDKHRDVLKDLQKLDLHQVIKHHGSIITKLKTSTSIHWCVMPLKNKCLLQ